MPPPLGPLLAYALAAASVGVVGLLDFLTGTELSLSAFYLLPVLIVAWWTNRAAGFVAAFLAALVWTFADRFGGWQFASPWIAPINTIIRFATFAVLVWLVSSLRKQLAFATFLVRTDALTGLVARRRFLELVDGEIQRSRRYGHPLSLAYVDVDDFKRVNDREGHAAGDALLRLVADTLQRGTRAIDVAARVGGDEFMLLMPETEADATQALIGRLHEMLARTVRSGAGADVTFSTGVITFLTPPADAAEAVRQVDQLMYRVKREGKDGFLHRVLE